MPALPERVGGAPLVVVGEGAESKEAMAAGRPIVASRLEGFESVVTDDETAELVPPRDSRSLAQGLAGVLTDALRRASLLAAASRRVEAYDWSQVARRVDHVCARAAPACDDGVRVGDDTPRHGARIRAIRRSRGADRRGRGAIPVAAIKGERG